jgi:hypothetical protein
MTDTASLPAGGPTREEIAKIEIGHTTVTPAVARGLTAFFLVVLVAVPAYEFTTSRRSSADQATTTAWSTLAELPQQVSLAADNEIARGMRSLWRRVVAANNAIMSALVAFENGLEDQSSLGRALRPHAQRILTAWAGAGNEQAYVGREAEGTRWLFYRPDVEYLTNRGFLDEEVMRQRTAVTSPPGPIPAADPRPAIRSFHRALASQGIALILVPTPVKPGVHPEKLARIETPPAHVVQNPSYDAFVRSLSSEGVLIFDPSDALLAARQSGVQYLATDTHWTPAAMERVAAQLAAFVAKHVTLPPANAVKHELEERRITNYGDVVVMLDLPAGQRLFPREMATITRVVAADGSDWRPDRAADVIVLGDSFSNIYSLASLGWGGSAGFAEHLSYALNRPLDRIVQNGDGAFATRAALQAAGPERLAGKRVVIWQFAARELAFGDWKMIP